MYLHLEQSGFNLSMSTGVCLEGEAQEFKLSSDFFFFFFQIKKIKKKSHVPNIRFCRHVSRQ